jgi:hypothetical protein
LAWWQSFAAEKFNAEPAQGCRVYPGSHTFPEDILKLQVKMDKGYVDIRAEQVFG